MQFTYMHIHENLCRCGVYSATCAAKGTELPGNCLKQDISILTYQGTYTLMSVILPVSITLPCTFLKRCFLTDKILFIFVNSDVHRR